MVKKSRREREEANGMRRLILVGGAATGLVLAGAGYLAMQPPEFPVLPGAASIGERLAGIGTAPHHQQLAGAGADLLVISDTGCAFCRDFMRIGLDPMIRFAEENGLSAAYLSIGFGRPGAVSTIASACMEREGSRLAGPDRVRALFALTAGGLPEGATPEEMITGSADLLGVPRLRLARCAPDEALAFRDRFEATRRLFQIERTPSFYLSAPGGSGRIVKIEGFSSASALTRQLGRALASDRRA
jgi:hypothetical protein